MNVMYTAHATAQAGRNGHVESDDGQLKLDLAMPKAMGGSGAGTNPEQLFAAGYSACFHSALLFVGSQQKANVAGSTVSGAVSIGGKEEVPGFHLAVELAVNLPNMAQAEAEALVHTAHQVCPYSNATRGNIPVTFTVTGQG
jgi:Ohr subfamily peroxiredoxin